MSLVNLVNLVNLSARFWSIFHLTVSAGRLRIGFAITNRGILFGAANSRLRWFVAIARM